MVISLFITMTLIIPKETLRTLLWMLLHWGSSWESESAQKGFGGLLFLISTQTLWMNFMWLILSLYKKCFRLEEQLEGTTGSLTRNLGEADELINRILVSCETESLNATAESEKVCPDIRQYNLLYHTTKILFNKH